MSNQLLVACAIVAALAVNPAFAQSTPQNQPVGTSMMGRNQGMMWGGMMWGGNSPGDYRAGAGMVGFGMMRGCPMMAGAGGPDFQRSASAWLDGQLAYLHSELDISDAQEPAWKAFAAAIRDRSGLMLTRHQSMMRTLWQDDLPFDQAYDAQIEMMQAHLEALKATKTAALTLYRALTPEQRQRAARALPQSMCLM